MTHSGVLCIFERRRSPPFVSGSEVTYPPPFDGPGAGAILNRWVLFDRAGGSDDGHCAVDSVQVSDAGYR